MRDFLRFIWLIPAFFRLWRDYEMEPGFIRFALRQYVTVMMTITGNRMSKLGYKAEDILRVMNDYYCEECREELKHEYE